MRKSTGGVLTLQLIGVHNIATHLPKTRVKQMRKDGISRKSCRNFHRICMCRLASLFKNVVSSKKMR